MQTKRYKLKVDMYGISYWFLLFPALKAMYKHVDSLCGEDLNPGFGYCLIHAGDRIVKVCLSAEWVSHYVIAHEAFHATIAAARLNKRRFNQKRWMAVRDDGDFLPATAPEERLADVCGEVMSELWRHLAKFKFKNNTIDLSRTGLK